MQIEDKFIAACMNQDRKAQKKLYAILLPYLRAVVKRYLTDISFEKDVLQESFVKIFTKIGQFDSNKGSFKTWAVRVTINACFNYNDRVIRQANKEYVQENGRKDLLVSAESGASNEDLLSFLKQMPQDYFAVFNLFIIDEYPHSEIAKLLNISEALSRKRLSRAKTWLKKNHEKIGLYDELVA